MGPINDECIHIGYNRPEVFRVLFSSASSVPGHGHGPLARLIPRSMPQ